MKLSSRDIVDHAMDHARGIMNAAATNNENKGALYERTLY